MKSGSGCPDQRGPPSKERGAAPEREAEGDKRQPGLREVESTSIASQYINMISMDAD
jgi:hypothetical protein